MQVEDINALDEAKILGYFETMKSVFLLKLVPRPNIAIPKPTGEDAAGAVALDSNWTLSPILRPSIAPLYAQR